MLRVGSLTSAQATLIGLFAPICWGMSVSLVRGIAEGFGMAQGQFFLYCVATICVFFIVGLPDFHRIDERYLYFGIPTANLSSLSFCLAIFTSSGGAQTMEVGMVNYLWPSLTILFAVDTLVFLVLWLLDIGSQPVAASAHGLMSVIFGGIAVGMAYVVWTLGMSKGNITVLAAASYFTPVLSCVFTTFWIGAELNSSFWMGVVLVVVGSLLCWDATGRGMKKFLKAA